MNGQRKTGSIGLIGMLACSFDPLARARSRPGRVASSHT
jgi:hypothetical protein